ncbi:MAG: hypothetical protein GXY14_09065 [Spirochaetes bacterium]|nr:hypothetical protein [Spirochaetota bacterium]
MQQDFSDFIMQLNRNNAEFVIIGGVALAFYGFPRYTGDLDIWIQPTLDNVKKVFKTIEDFFNSTLSVLPEDFITGNNMITLGEEPVQIQIHLYLDGVTAEEIWSGRITGKFGSNDVYYIGKNVFIKNKKVVGRDQDIIDIKKIQP